MNKYNLKVGQSLFLKPVGSLRTEALVEYKIEKIGRRWVTLSNHARVSLETLRTESGTRTAWLSEQHHKAQELDAAWRQLTTDFDRMRYNRPAHLTVEVIKEIRLKLGI